MLQLWTANKVGTPQTRIGPLSECTEALIRRKINDEYTLTVQLPPGAEFENDVEPGQVIVSPVDESGTEDRFVIKQRMRRLTGGMEIYAEHQSYVYNGYICKPLTITRDHQGFLFETAQDVFLAIRTNAVPSVASSQFVWSGMFNKAAPMTEPPKVPSSLRALLLGWYVQEFGKELDFYRTVITAKDRLGADNGASIRYAVNMLELGADDVVDDYASGIMPFWGSQGDSSKPLTMLPEGYIEYTPTAYFPFRKIVPVDFSDYFERQPTETQLRDTANAYAAENAVPYIPRSFSAEHVQRDGDRPINLGDDVKIINETWRLTTKLRIVGVTFDALQRRVVGVEIGKLNPGFAGAVRKTR